MKSYNFFGGRSLRIVVGITMLALLLVGSAEAAPLMSIEEAVDNSALNFTNGGDVPWFGQDTVSYFGGDAAQSGLISDSQRTWVQTNVTNIGLLSFFWKVSSESDFDLLEFYIDGMLIDSISGEVNWTKKNYSIGAGNHTLKWSYRKDGSGSAGNDAGWIDKIDISQPLPLEEAVDNTALNLASGGNALWFGQDTVSYFGGDAAQSGRISDSQSTWIQTNVTNIGLLSFFWKVSSESGFDLLEFYIDGMLIDSISGEVNWTNKYYSIGAGNHTLKWSYRKDGSSSVGNDAGWIDKIDISQPLPLEEAVDNTALNLASGGNALWFGQDTVSYFGGDAAQSGRISDSQSTLVQTNVTNIGSLSFFWKVSSESGFDLLEFYIDGMLIDSISGEVNWTKKNYSIGAGNHTLKWRYRKDGGGSAGNDAGWIDKIEFQPLVSIEEAVDNTALNFTSWSNALWFGQDTVSYFGGDAAQSGRISDSQSTWIQTNVTNIGLLSFFWKVSSESGFDLLEFYIDGMLIDSISGEVNWTEKNYSIDAGNHTLRWSYRKDGSYSAGNDTGWVDKIEQVGRLNVNNARTNKISYSLNENVTVSCAVRNETMINISVDNVKIKITKPDFSIEWLTMNEGLVGKYEGLFKNTSLPGTYNITIYANKTGMINDTDELSFEVMAEHDIAITNIEAPIAIVNSPINVIATVRNYGLNDESNIIVDFIVDGINKNNRIISFLKSGSSTTINFWTAPDVAGMYNITISARPVVNEIMVYNNRLNRSIFVDHARGITTWSGSTSQGRLLYFNVEGNSQSHFIEGYHTSILCQDKRGLYTVTIDRGNIIIPIINNYFDFYGEFKGTFTSSTEASGQYSFSIGPCYQSGTWSASGAMPDPSDPIRDSSEPRSISNLTNITYAPNYINFTWTNPLDPDFSDVMLYLNGTFLTSTQAPQIYFNVTGLTPDTEYELGTHTMDSSGNINQTWMNATARTAPGTTNPSITVVSPNGGEILPRGTNQTIRWNYTGSPGSFVNITLLKNEVFNRTINSSVPIGSSGNGSYNWLISSTQRQGSDYKVRIMSTTNATFNDTSDNNFTILPIPTGYSYIYGKVVNDSVGIAGVFVITNTTVSTTTDISGFYSMLVPAGHYNLNATKEPAYYMKNSVFVTAISGTAVVKDIILIRKLTSTISGTVRRN